jgi:hypothetical protein
MRVGFRNFGDSVCDHSSNESKHLVSYDLQNLWLYQSIEKIRLKECAITITHEIFEHSDCCHIFF